MDATRDWDMIKALTNREISETYRNASFMLARSEVMGKFAEWVVRQSFDKVPDITNALSGFSEYISEHFPHSHPVHIFTYDELYEFISEEKFKGVPQILELNTRPGNDFIDLGALARNVFFSLCREAILDGAVPPYCLTGEVYTGIVSKNAPEQADIGMNSPQL